MKQSTKARILFGFSLVLSVRVIWGAFLLGNSFARWKRLQREVSQARKGIEKVESIKREVLRRKRLMARLENVVKRAQALGLSPEQWGQYDVEVQETVSFPRLAEILKQAGPGYNYYFEPIYLYLSRSKPRKEGDPPAPAPAPQRSESREGGALKGGDIYLKVKGSFLVRK